MDETMNDDLILLREYARRDSEEAFAALVSRHVKTETDETWPQIAPLLDGAMEQLGQKDHVAPRLSGHRTANHAKYANRFLKNSFSHILSISRFQFIPPISQTILHAARAWYPVPL
jgi:hypothetical protein